MIYPHFKNHHHDKANILTIFKFPQKWVVIRSPGRTGIKPTGKTTHSPYNPY